MKQKTESHLLLSHLICTEKTSEKRKEAPNIQSHILR